MPQHGRTPPLQPKDRQFQAEYLEHVINGPHIHLDLDGHNAWVVMAALQLALRHPNMTPSLTAQLRRIVDGLIERLSCTPLLAAAARAGDDSRYDRPGGGE